LLDCLFTGLAIQRDGNVLRDHVAVFKQHNDVCLELDFETYTQFKYSLSHFETMNGTTEDDAREVSMVGHVKSRGKIM
jgi:hypothetical protein